MKTRIDWKQAARNGLRITKHGVGQLLVITGKLMVGIGALLHQLGKRLAPYSRPHQ